MWNIMKCFIYGVKRVAIYKVFWKAKMKYLEYMSKINVQYNAQNNFNIKYIANKKRGKTSWKIVYDHMSYSDIFQNTNNAL